MKHTSMSKSYFWISSRARSVREALTRPHFESNFRIFFLSLTIAIAIGVLRTWVGYQIRPFLGNGAGDFSFATRMARDLWNMRDPYAYPVKPDSVSYPLPAGIVAMPFALFKDEIASGLFMGVSSFILAWLLLKNGRTWSLLLFLSWPFAYAVFFSQWTPLIMTLWFLPFMLPLLLVKPHIAIPLVLTGKVSRMGIILTIALLLVSLIAVPNWPFTWLKQINTYKGLPPITALPLGPLILVALFKFRDRRAWLLVLLALMPQRVLYDQLPLLLLATTGFQMAFLVFCSWLTLPVLFMWGGWGNVPVNWQFWIVITLYIPALLILFWPDLRMLFRKSRKTPSVYSPNEGETSAKKPS
jgi:hypothetical protein